jgi:hypothetical protein
MNTVACHVTHLRRDERVSSHSSLLEAAQELGNNAGYMATGNDKAILDMDEDVWMTWAKE